MLKTRQHQRGKLTTFASIALLSASFGALAGCGGSSAPKATTVRAGETPTQTNADVGGVQTGGKQVHRPPRRPRRVHTSSSRHAQVQTARGTAATTSAGQGNKRSSHPNASARGTAATTSAGQGNKRSSQPNASARGTAATTSAEQGNKRISQPNPCALVRLSEAQTITGGLIAGRVEAPLGPTCIYRLDHSKTDITLAVESMSFSQVTHQMVKRTPVIVGGRRAYCGKLGAQMLFVPLAKGRLLNVTAPCPVAQQFAARALSRLVS